MKLKNIPNILSVIRILLVFVFVYVVFVCDNLLAALFVFFLAGATDVVDGYLARRNNWITNLGKILDPFADKLMQCTVLVCLWIKNIVSIWFALAFFLKEFITLLLGALAIKRRSVNVVSRWYGKLAVCLFYLTIAISVIWKDFLSANPIIALLIYVPTAVFGIGAMLGYIKHYSYLRKEAVCKDGIINNIRKGK